MKLLHTAYGEITIIEVNEASDKTTIRVKHSNGETSSMTWNVLWENNMVKIISDDKESNENNTGDS